MTTLDIIFENDDFLVLNKPSGLMVHGDGRSEGETLADMILTRYPEMKEVGEPMEISLNGKTQILYRPGIVHRLDKDTSGVMVVAKNQEMFEHLKSQFKNREVSKVYNAIVWGQMKEKEGVIDESIGRSPSDFRRWSASRGKRGEAREAVTLYKTVQEFEKGGEKFSLLEVRPKTGRTHQIRVHMQYLQRPIVCDSLYAVKKPCILVGRLALHAREISFSGLQGEKHHFIVPLPGDMMNALAK